MPRQYIPSVEKGVRAQMEQGVLAGYPMTGMRVTLYDGKAHSVDSSDMAFQKAGRAALKDACEKASPTLLEPVHMVEISVPNAFTSKVQRLVSGIGSTLPIAMSNLDTFDLLRRIAQTRGRLAADSPRKYDTARALFDEHVDADELLRRLQVSPPSVVTPLMFEYGILERARETGDKQAQLRAEIERLLERA